MVSKITMQIPRNPQSNYYKTGAFNNCYSEGKLSTLNNLFGKPFYNEKSSNREEKLYESLYEHGFEEACLRKQLLRNPQTHGEKSTYYNRQHNPVSMRNHEFKTIQPSIQNTMGISSARRSQKSCSN